MSEPSEIPLPPNLSEEASMQEDLTSSSTSQTSQPITRDEDYYLYDGTCVFLVENRLFKIHRWLLERDSAIFQDMFALPQPTEGAVPSSVEGSCDEKPIICPDTIKEFRALCWALYAQPTEIVAQLNHKTANVPRMILVIAMAHKYAMGNLRRWALDALHRVANEGLITLSCKSWANVQKLLDISCQCSQTDLALQIQLEWLKNIDTKSGELIPFISALEVAERRGKDLRPFHGLVYYTYLKATGKFNASPNDKSTSKGNGDIFSPAADEPESALGEARRLRLYHGFWSLTQLRHRLDAVPMLNKNPQCTKHAAVCRSAWAHLWRDFLSIAQKKRIRDPGEFLLKLQERIVAEPIRFVVLSDDESPIQVPCRAQIKAQVRAMKKQFDDTLADHFMISSE